MQITEIFFSLQGESSYAGLPCIFIRTAGCNLRCRYCDTNYSYGAGSSRTIDQIMTEIRQYTPVNLVEITGGEPLLQDDVIRLCEKLHEKDYLILLETNGSLSLRKVPGYVVKIVDVKTPGSGFEKSFLPENLAHLDSEKDEMKFVISDRIDYEWSIDFIKRNELEKHKILFSAVSDKISPGTLADWIVADKLQVRLQLQLHKLLWGKDRRGV